MCDHDLIIGRPYGGCTIFFRKCLSHSITCLNPCSTRFCALLLNIAYSTHRKSVIVINVYLPTNYGSDGSTTTFRETIAELEDFLLTQKYDHVIIAGDFNVDFNKTCTNQHILENFMKAFDLVRGDTCFNISFTYKHDDFQSSSWIDPVLCSSGTLASQ